MTIYAIGDIQGCFQELKALLKKINFSIDKDQLWFTGDLVNRGPQSLETLRFVKNLGENAITVLGNHDLHMLAVLFEFEKPRKKDTLNEILSAPDKQSLMDWVREQPLMHLDETHKTVLIHAGIYPAWSIPQAQNYANEVQQILRDDRIKAFLQNMYGNEPDAWNEELTGWPRIRFITNCFTRMRYCSDKLALNMDEKGKPGSQATHLQPWFDFQNDSLKDYRIVMGHWSTLGHASQQNVFAIDSGCLWGGKLTAMRIDGPNEFFTVNCKSKQSIH